MSNLAYDKCGISTVTYNNRAARPMSSELESPN